MEAIDESNPNNDNFSVTPPKTLEECCLALDKICSQEEKDQIKMIFLEN